MSTWTTREDLAEVIGRPSTLPGLVLPASSGPSAVHLTDPGLQAAVATTVDVLSASGLGPSDRVVVALAQEPDGAVVLTEALRRCCGAVVAVGPRGRMRLHRTIESTRPTVLVTTPTGAMDLLARLHLEFLVEPEELGLERIVLTGEIPSPGSHRQLAAEFGCEIHELWCDPAYGVALGHRRADADDGFAVPDGDLVGLAALDRDQPVTPGGDELVEVVVRPRWAEGPATELVLRTGWVAPATHALPVPTNTVGDLVLIRGRWVSAQAMRNALARIDGVDAWTIEVSREGTLDRAVVHVALGRDSLLENPMWAGRIAEVIGRVTPVGLDSDVRAAADWPGTGAVDDRRGHHLGIDRTAVNAGAGA